MRRALVYQNSGVGSKGGKMILTPIHECCLLHWTESAKYCYKIGCTCSRCIYPNTLETIRPDNCRMKAVVLGLIKKYGIPK